MRAVDAVSLLIICCTSPVAGLQPQLDCSMQKCCQARSQPVEGPLTYKAQCIRPCLDCFHRPSCIKEVPAIVTVSKRMALSLKNHLVKHSAVGSSTECPACDRSLTSGRPKGTLAGHEVLGLQSPIGAPHDACRLHWQRMPTVGGVISITQASPSCCPLYSARYASARSL